jgi:two-component system nitrogen regulation sensor histidine kinase GlnL
LIVDEADRIIGLVERMSVFSDGVPVNRSSLNIHTVLDHAKQVAANGFARGCSFFELYDPSLPPVAGDRDLLVQVFLNLLKNAAEAMSPNGGEIQIQTAYRHGVRLAVPGVAKQVHLPLQVTIRDAGSGIPADLVPHLFEPFVTTKNEGTGLGLALAVKVIGDHGGVIECDSVPGRTEFRIFLPRARAVKS